MFGRLTLPRSELASLRAEVPGARVLAWASGRQLAQPAAAAQSGDGAEPPTGSTAEPGAGSEVYAVALIGQFAVGRAGAWTLAPWHDIVHGGWHPDNGYLTWTDGPGRRHAVVLDAPGRLPDVFRERVDATLLVRDRVGPDDAGMVVSAHRRLDDPDAPPVWRTTTLDGAAQPSAATVAAARARLAELRRDVL